MGQQARVTNKRVLTRVEDCVGAVNDVIIASEELLEKHNALCLDLNAKHAETNERLAGHGAWCEANEASLAGLRASVARTLELLAGASATLADVASDVDAVDAVVAGTHERMNGHISRLYAELRAFDDAGFIARLRWLFTGARPQIGDEASVDHAEPSPVSVETPAGALTL